MSLLEYLNRSDYDPEAKPPAHPPTKRYEFHDDEPYIILRWSPGSRKVETAKNALTRAQVVVMLEAVLERARIDLSLEVGTGVPL